MPSTVTLQVVVTANNIPKVGGNIVTGLQRALRMEAEEILLAAKMLTPVDRGWLQASGKVQGPWKALGVFEVAITFGDSATPYALIVHENLQARHASPTQAKFLETPAKRAEKGFGPRLLSRAGGWA